VNLGSLSKTVCPGPRVGWMAGPSHILEEAARLKFADEESNTFTQAVAAKYLESGRMDEHLNKVRDKYRDCARAMCEELQKINKELGDVFEFTPPQGGMFVWARLTGKNGAIMSASQLAELAIAAGVAFVPGGPFDAEGGSDDKMRLAFATSDEKTIREGIRKLGAVMRATMAGQPVAAGTTQLAAL
jgi:DNA-binding transcriptional MocR family regulator